MARLEMRPVALAMLVIAALGCGGNVTPPSAAGHSGSPDGTERANASGGGEPAGGAAVGSGEGGAAGAGHAAVGGGGGGGTGGSTSKVACGAATVADPAAACHTDADCSSGSSCLLETPPAQRCGSPCPGCAANRCSKDSDCTNGVCEPSKEFPGVIEQCVPRCDAKSCLPDERCESDGRCRPMPCTAGFTCVDHTRCSAGSALADAHGCEPIPCDEAGGAACIAPSVCTRESPRQPSAANGCALVPCADPRHPGCGPNLRCRPELETGGNYGCTRMQCKNDADCDCGACLAINGADGYCYDHAGVCVPKGILSCPP